MEEIAKNHQLVYRDIRNAKGMSMGLLTFGYRQFLTTKRFEKLAVIKKLCEDFSPTQPPDIRLLSDLAFDNLLDSIKITICFENFIKSLLLSNGFVIHKLDKAIFPELAKEQYSKPISFHRVKAICDWEINPKLNVPEEWMKKQIKGINTMTIGMKELLSADYLSLLNISDEIIKICTPYFKYRNNLHLYSGESITFTKSDYKDFVKIIDFINRDLIRIQNMIVDDLNKGDNYKLPPIIYS